jgi:hypothetical protein
MSPADAPRRIQGISRASSCTTVHAARRTVESLTRRIRNSMPTTAASAVARSVHYAKAEGIVSANSGSPFFFAIFLTSCCSSCRWTNLLSTMPTRSCSMDRRKTDR